MANRAFLIDRTLLRRRSGASGCHRAMLSLCCFTWAASSDSKISGDACLPADVRSLLKGDAVRRVGTACSTLLSSQRARDCTPDCLEALRDFQAERCYPHISQSQRLQPRYSAPFEHLGGVHSQHTITSLQGRWYGLYPASGVELLEATLEPSTGVLSGVKLTGNSFVGAGRVSWTVSSTSCKVVSSLWQGVYTPRWDPCKLLVIDEDHMQLVLSMGEDAEEVLSFVRATLPLLLDWEDANSPTHGFFAAMLRCGLEPEETATSLIESLMETLHHTHGTVLLDQVLLFLPLAMLGAWQLREQRFSLLAFLPVLIIYGTLVWARLTYLGLAE